MSHHQLETEQDVVLSKNTNGSSSVVLVCEHASSYIPPIYKGLGLSPQASQSHAAWDPGALEVALRLSKLLDAPLIASGVSRLVQDNNRPPNAPDAMPSRSEVIDIPGNKNLTPQDRDARSTAVYVPFHAAVRDTLGQSPDPILVTIHSFTPIYHGHVRAVEIGVLHDTDTRLADAMMDTAHRHTDRDVQRNAPYGPTDGVTHTLQEHGIKNGHLNVMLEIRNDLIATQDQQDALAGMLSAWIKDACGAIVATESSS